MQQLRRLAALPRLSSASFCDVPLTDEGLGYVCECTTLDNLRLQHTALTNGGLAVLARLPALRYLRLKDNPQLDDGCVPHLSALTRLVNLQVHETSIRATGLMALSGVPDLEELVVDTETGSREALEALSRKRPKCEILVKGQGSFFAGRFEGRWQE